MKHDFDDSILPCPECGLKRRAEILSTVRSGFYFVYCPECYFSTGHYMGKEKALMHWNNVSRRIYDGVDSYYPSQEKPLYSVGSDVIEFKEVEE